MFALQADALADKSKPLNPDETSEIVNKLYTASRQSSDDPSIIGNAKRVLEVLSNPINNEEVS